MRDIKFRCWNEHGKVMHDWGELVRGNKIHLLSDKNPTYKIMQLTDFKDKKGIEVYDGDIIKSFLFTDRDDVMHFLEFKIKWSEKFSGWVVVRGDGSEMQLWAYSKSLDGYFYVIGNIYENPELLK